MHNVLFCLFRPQVLKKLGWGHFSTVWLVKNHTAAAGSARELLALKIQKSSKRYVGCCCC